MFVRLTYFAIQPEKKQEVKQIYIEEVSPVIHQQKGIKEVLLLEPVSAGDEYISFTVWESEADIKAFEASSSYPGVFGRIRDLALQPPHQKYYGLDS